MKIEVKKLSGQNEEDYKSLIESIPSAMFNHSLKYKSFLTKILNGANDNYLLAYENEKPVAALPIFLKHGPIGTVLNSLPFYGSHGGIISCNRAAKECIHALMEEYKSLLKINKVYSAAIIEAPLGSNQVKHDLFPSNYMDKRIGQITYLPETQKDADYKVRLFDLFHQKTRNSVRKGMKGNFLVGHDNSEETFNSLYKLHKSNMEMVGGIVKPWEVFATIKDHFIYEKDYKIYTARYNEQIVSAVLVFYFKDFVEYFCPATEHDYKSQQPLSLLIFNAMFDAVVQKQAKYWNWGGTWPSQKGVYSFKSRWGAKEFTYRYFIQVNKDIEIFRKFGKDKLLTHYQFFYTIPFNEIENT